MLIRKMFANTLRLSTTSPQWQIPDSNTLEAALTDERDILTRVGRFSYVVMTPRHCFGMIKDVFSPLTDSPSKIVC
jgi:hypothetical protein